MSKNSGRIKDWLYRSFAGLANIGSGLTLASAVAIGVMSITTAAVAVLVVTFAWVVVAVLIKSNSALLSQVAGYSTLGAAVCGAILGVLYVGQPSAK